MADSRLDTRGEGRRQDPSARPRSIPPAHVRAEADGILTRAGALPDADIDVGLAALALAVRDDIPPRSRLALFSRAPLARYRARLQALTRDVGRHYRRSKGETLDDRLVSLNEVLVARHGYAGDSENYEDLRNASLAWVMERKRGFPVALGVLYMAIARAQGWSVTGLDFPSHFLLRMDLGGQRVIVDPFHHGSTHDAASLRALLKIVHGQETPLRPEHYRPASNRDVLLRLQNNLKLRLIRDRQVERAASVVEGMLMFAPDRTGLLRELALLQAHIGNIGLAISSLETYMEREAGDQPRYEAALLLRELKGRLHQGG